MSKRLKITLVFVSVIAFTAILGGVVLSKSTGNLETIKNMQVEDVDVTNLPDGAFEGNYDAFPISVTVKVTIKDHRIKNIELTKHNNGKGGAAESIPEKVVEAQSLRIDAVTGATYSSKVIVLAIKDALQKAAGR